MRKFVQEEHKGGESTEKNHKLEVRTSMEQSSKRGGRSCWAMDNAMEELSRSYQGSEKTAGKADQGADHGAGERKLHGKKFIFPALTLVLGFLLALLLVGR